jgi:hypothetical protein
MLGNMLFLIFCLPGCYLKILILKYTKLMLSVLYACDTWSGRLGDGNRLTEREMRQLRRIFGPWEVVLIGRWRKFHNKELYNLCSLTRY